MHCAATSAVSSIGLLIEASDLECCVLLAVIIISCIALQVGVQLCLQHPGILQTGLLRSHGV
jgi:hypothetical protein